MVMESKSLTQQFNEFHEANPEVLVKMRELALQVKARGYKQFSVYAIMERLRWFVDIETDDPNSHYKINNNYRPFYARLLMETTAELDGFFRTRPAEADDEPLAVQ